MTLEQIIESIRPMVANGARPTKERIRVLWAGAKMARKVGAVDTIHRAFMPLAFCPSVARRGTGDAVAGRRVRPADRR